MQYTSGSALSCMVSAPGSLHFVFLKPMVVLPRPGSVVVERSPGMREVGGSIPDRVKQKTLKFEVLLLCLALSTKELGRLRVRIMVWVGTSLLTRGVVFQWASTIKTGRRSD